MGDWESILDGDGIEAAIVHTKPPSAIFLAYQEYWRGVRTGAGFDDSIFKHISDKGGHDLLLIIGVSVRLDIDWLGPGKGGDTMVLRAMGWK